ncbi:MAG: TonB-dependent receptor domain-containing protein [Longimicrobiales bacterium]
MSNHRLLRSAALLLLALSALGLSVSHARAQGAGRLVGRVVDATTGAGISAAQVELIGPQIGTLTTLDGRYVLNNVPAGQITLKVSSIGYSPKTVVGIVITAGAVIEQNLTLDTEAVQIGPLQVSAAAERGSVNRALDQQRTATAIVNSVTAEQISKSPDSDAAAAVQRVAGVTLVDNKYVQVRGLGERYTTTSLNGARIPSPEPEKKLVPLDLFPSGLLETITTSKTFTPDQPGDFSGASVDIRTREFPAGLQQSLSTSFGWNSAASGRIFAAPVAGGEWLGFSVGERGIPAGLRAAGNFINSPSQQQINGFVNSFRNAWSATGAASRPSTSVGYSLGGNGPVFGQHIGYVLSGTYSNGQEVREDEVRALAQATEGGGTLESDRYVGSTGRTSVLWGGVLNASTLIGSHSRIALNSTYNRSADNEARQELGTSEDYGGLPLEVTRLRYIERSVGSLQLLGEHEFSGRNRLTWSVTGSEVSRKEPDRSEFVYAFERDPSTDAPLPAAWLSSAGEGAVRTFGDLSETAFEGSVNYRLSPRAARLNHIKLGALTRLTDREAGNRVYSITAPLLTRTGRELQPEQIFDGRFANGDQSFFRVAPLSQGGSYAAQDQLLAGYLLFDWGLSEKLRVIAGARVERSAVELQAEPTVGAPVESNPTFTDVLPALTLNYLHSERQNIRFSVSQTLSRPEYREMAEIQYRDVIGGENVIGNPDLHRALVRNFDLRWELYPSNGEVISIAAFAKLFEDPIERVYLSTSGTRIVTFQNAEGARNYGVELEARKRLGFLSEGLESVTAFVNSTIMSSEIEIGGSGASIANDKRAMVGQSPYVVNAGLTFAPGESNFSSTLLYNVVGKRIVSAATRPLPSVYEQSRPILDFAVRTPVYRSISAKLDVRNLLDSPFEVTQGDVVRESCRVGRNVSVGLSWRP